MTGRTAEGRQAYAILSWANDDPQARAAEAADRVGDLAAGLLAAGGPALREVQDVGTVLARLHSAVSQVPAPRPPVTMAGTITAQVIDLADWDPAKHPRGEHGKFVRKGTAAADVVKASLDGRSAAATRGSARSDVGAISDNLQQQFGKKKNGVAGTISGQIAGGDFVPRSDFEALQKQVKALQDRAAKDAKTAQEHLEKSEERMEDREKANLVKEGIITLGGAALIGLLTGGIGSVVALPYIIEKSPELVGLLYSHFVVGKGVGRHLVAHPGKAAKHAAVKVANHPAVAPRMAAFRTLIRPGSAAAGLANEVLFAGSPGFVMDESVAAQTAVSQLASLLVGGGMPEQDADAYARAMLREYVDTNGGFLDRNGVDTAALSAALQ